MTRKGESETARHPIGVVEQRTGIPQDVIRVWERRYGAVKPERGPGGQRVYGDDDIERLRLLQAATSAGRRIGSVARLPTAELARLVEEDAAAIEALRAPAAAIPPDASALLDEVLALTHALDAQQLDATLRRAAARLGWSAFVETVALPVLRRVGDEWHAGRLSSAQEHLVSSALHDIVAESMRALASGNGAARLVVATPAGERHAIGAALVGATAAVEGWNVIYLGADLPAEEIASAAIASDAQVVAISVIYVDERERLLDEMRRLRARLPARVSLIAGGAGASQLGAQLAAIGVDVVPSLTDLYKTLRRGAERA